jgi:protease-4
MDKEQLQLISDGRIFTADEAKKLGLIDQIGYMDSAIDLAKQEAGIKEARVILYRRPSQYANNVYSSVGFFQQPDLLSIAPLAKELLHDRSLNFFYIWMP